MQQRQRLHVRQNTVQEQHTNVNMSSIHCKIQEEAEKIRKWQTTSEIELKQKMTKLKECELLITKQRNHILEVQIENENLATELQREQEAQIQINMKLKTSRELFIALKTHTENLQSSIMRGEEDRDSLRMLAADNIRQIKEMKFKMQEIVVANDDRVQVLKVAIKNKELAVEDIKFNSEKEIGKAKKTNETLDHEIARCKVDIDNISIQLLDKRNVVINLEEKIQSLEDTLVKQKAVVSSKDSTIQELQSVIDDTSAAYTAVQEDLTKLQQDTKDKIEEQDSFKELAQQQIDELQSELTELTESLTDLSTRYNEMTSKHDRLESENLSLKESVSQLVKCVEELQEKQEQNEQEMRNLTNLYNQSKEREAELSQLLEEKEADIVELSSQKEDLESNLKLVSEDFEKLKLKESKYLSEIEQFSVVQAEQNQRFEELDKKYSEQSTTQTKQIAAELDAKENVCIKLEKKCEEYKTKHESVISLLTTKNCEVEKLSNDKASLQSDVQSFLQNLHTLENQHHNLNQGVSTIQSNFDECCKELESTKSTVTTQELKLSKRNAELKHLKKQALLDKEKYQGLREANKKTEQHLYSAQEQKHTFNKALKERSSLCKDLENKVSQLEGKVKTLVKELDDSKNTIESSVQGASSLNQSLTTQLKEARITLSSKDDLISILNEEICNFKKKQENDSRNISESMKLALNDKDDLEKEKAYLTKMLANKNADISALAEEINKLQNKINSLESSCSKKSAIEVKTLQDKILKFENQNAALSIRIEEHEREKSNFKSLRTSLESQQSKQEIDITKLMKRNEELHEKSEKLIQDNKKLDESVKAALKEQSNSVALSQKLKQKEEQLVAFKSNMDQIKTDFLTIEKGYKANIDKLKDEIKHINKEKVKKVLLSASHPKAQLPSSPNTPPKKTTAYPESPKTPSVSKKRRVAFGKSPSWRASDAFSDDEEDNTVSSSTNSTVSRVKYMSVGKSPQLQTYVAKSPKSPARLKLSSRSPKAESVKNLIATYPKPGVAQKRGIKLPDAYLKRKEENAAKKKKIKVESSSWFDNDTAFGFDEK